VVCLMALAMTGPRLPQGSGKRPRPSGPGSAAFSGVL
jgi:hypothetical protein